MILVNPFTRQVLNSDVPNPRGCNQHTGPNCSKNDIRKRLEEVADIPIDWDDETMPQGQSGGFVMGLTKSELERFRGGRAAKIKIARHPYEKEIAGHEIGHSLSPPSPVDYEGEDENDPMLLAEERAAWKYALKKRRELGLSKRKLLQLVRSVGYKRGVDWRRLISDKMEEPEYKDY